MPVRTLGEVVGREWWWGWGWCWGWGWNDLQCLGAKWNWDLCGGKPLTTFWRFLSSETKTKIVLSRLRVQIGKGCSKWSAEGKEDGWLGGEDKASSRINVLICYAPTCRLSLVLSPQIPPWFCVIFTRWRGLTEHGVDAVHLNSWKRVEDFFFGCVGRKLVIHSQWPLPGSQIVRKTRKRKAHENMSAWSGKRGRWPFLSPFSSRFIQFCVRAFSIPRTRLFRSLEQATITDTPSSRERIVVA